jgi:hypothetical protein
MERENKKHCRRTWFLYLFCASPCRNSRSGNKIPTGVAALNDRFPPAIMAVEIRSKSSSTGGKKIENNIFYSQGTVPSLWLRAHWGSVERTVRILKQKTFSLHQHEHIRLMIVLRVHKL